MLAAILGHFIRRILNSFCLDWINIKSYRKPEIGTINMFYSREEYKCRNDMKFFRFAVRPSVSLNPGPFYVVEGSNATLPVCHVTGYPRPLVTWSKSFGQLPQGRVDSNNSVIKLSGVRKADSDNYLCTATNLLGTVVKRTVLVVVSLPKFNVKPLEKVTALIGETFTLNCTATGDPQPVVNWKKQGAQFPVGRSQEINGVLFIRNTKKEDAGNYICAAMSAGFFTVETVTSVEVLLPKGKQVVIFLY